MREAYPPAAAQHLSQPAPHPSLSQSTLHQTSGERQAERERKKERGKEERSEGEHTTTCATRVSSPSASADAASTG